MKNILLIILSIFSFLLFAQDEFIVPLKVNTNLYYQTKAFHNVLKKEFVEDNIIVTSDSISLPFIDDFSRNTLKPYDFNTVIVNDTIQYAYGTCIDNEFATLTTGFQTSQSYYFFYDTLAQQVDSIALNPIIVEEYSNGTCFPNETGTTTYWPSFYRSVDSNFNTVTGFKIDSILITPDVTLDIATIYFATMPSTVNWMDNFAWWNTTNPIDPISIGVATLDGLNQFGLPYNKTVTNAYGKADVLTSKPIDLSLLSVSDDVYLSFFYQAGGIGDLPNNEDSLVVEFKGADDVWQWVWSTDGTASTDFKQIYIPIYNTTFDSLIYSNTAFQFRFRNYASLSGNNDLWNIDYVRLDKNRQPNTLDTVIRDITMLYDFPNYLQNFSMLPWKQMEAGADQFIDTIKIPVRDNGQVEGLVAGNFPLDVSVTNTDTIYNEIGSSFNTVLGQEIKEHEILPFTNFTLPTITNTDSLYFHAEMVLGAVNRNLLLANDTIKSEILFHNILAYDDGSAERAYGVSGGGTEVKRFAYEFNVAVQDTLAAIQIHFSNIDINVADLVFSFFVWDSLEIGISEDSIVHQIGSIENKKAVYLDEKNSFATFVFNAPIIVTDKFYIGWAQIDNRNLQIGYDLNSTKGREHMYVFTANTWKASTINLKGSPMIRAVLDGDYPIPPPTPTSINTVEKLEYIKVYPNPTNNYLNIEMPTSLDSYIVRIFDYAGKVLFVEENTQKIDVTHLTKSIYFLQIEDTNTGKNYASRFVKN
tara:strand:- start:674 stop:2941 length:2268 start_codon:yes stop_codon:yes gene_type:complete